MGRRKGSLQCGRGPNSFRKFPYKALKVGNITVQENILFRASFRQIIKI